jgi:hypothetical protein
MESLTGELNQSRRYVLWKRTRAPVRGDTIGASFLLEVQNAKAKFQSQPAGLALGNTLTSCLRLQILRR